MKISYRKGRKIDSKQLLNLYVSVGWEKEFDKDTAKELARMHSNATIVFSAWNKKELIGVIRVLTDKIENGVIFGLVVKKEYQKKGIGTKLIKMCFSKYPKVEWFISTENPKTKKLYAKLGFRKTKNEWFNKQGK